MEIYHYDADGIFLNKGAARPDPLDRKPMVPANATLIAPPETGDNEVAIWAKDTWTVKSDYRGAEYWLEDGSHHTITKIGETPPDDVLDAEPPLPREDQRKAALSRVDAEHANYLVTLTGGATVAERDTWKVKEEAARAYLILEASDGQIAMLAAEAAGSGITKDVLAQKIVAKAEAFLALIGMAAGLRAKGRIAIMSATDEAVPLDQVGVHVEVVFEQLAEQVQAAVSDFMGGG